MVERKTNVTRYEGIYTILIDSLKKLDDPFVYQFHNRPKWDHPSWNYWTYSGSWACFWGWSGRTSNLHQHLVTWWHRVLQAFWGESGRLRAHSNFSNKSESCTVPQRPTTSSIHRLSEHLQINYLPSAWLWQVGEGRVECPCPESSLAYLRHIVYSAHFVILAPTPNKPWAFLFIFKASLK